MISHQSNHNTSKLNGEKRLWLPKKKKIKTIQKKKKKKPHGRTESVSGFRGEGADQKEKLLVPPSNVLSTR